MGQPLPSAALPSGLFTPATGDRANTVISGAFSAVGPGSPITCYGAFNVMIWASVTKSLTTTNASGNATVADTTGLAAGMGVNSAKVPPGTTIKSITNGTTMVLAFPPQYDNTAVVTGTANAVFTGDGTTGQASFALERTFDGGSTWLTCNIGGGGTPAEYSFGGGSGLTAPVSVVVAEPEQGVSYRLNCTAYTSGAFNYRVSTTGLGAVAWGIPVG